MTKFVLILSILFTAYGLFCQTSRISHFNFPVVGGAGLYEVDLTDSLLNDIRLDEMDSPSFIFEVYLVPLNYEGSRFFVPDTIRVSKSSGNPQTDAFIVRQLEKCVYKSDFFVYRINLLMYVIYRKDGQEL